MKKIYSILMALAVVMSVSAASAAKTRLIDPQHRNGRAATEMKAHHHHDFKAARAISGMAKAPARSESDSEVILVPDGSEQDYMVKSTGFVDSMFGIMYTQGTYPTKIAWGDDGETVYIRDIVTTAYSGVYVKGTYADGKVTVQLPQVCYYENYEGEEFTLLATVAEFYAFEEDGEVWYGYKNVETAEENVVEYTLDADGTLTLRLNDGDPDDIDAVPERIIALVDDPTPGIDAWMGLGDSYQEFSEFNLAPNELPEDVELETWALMSTNLDTTADVGFKDGKVYITNFWEYAPEFVAIGNIEDDKVVFPTQYLGEVMGFYGFLMGCEWEDEEFMDCEMLDELVFNYNAEAKRMAVDNPLIDMLINSNLTDYDPLDYYENPTIQYQNEDDLNAAPENPWVNFFDPYQYQAWLGSSEGYIDWMIPSTNVNGFLLPTDQMYYHFLIDGNIMTFTTEMYPGFPEDLTDIPYDFGDDFDIQVLGQSHYITYKWDKYETFGLQSFFVNSAGETFASDLITYVPEEGAVAVANTAKEVKSIEYYDLHGRRVSTLGTGVYVARYVFADGTSTTAKLCRK